MEAPVRVDVVACQAVDGSPERWLVTFRLRNLGSVALVLRDAWIPHGRFRGEGHVPLSASLGPGAEYRLTLGVTAQEAPGTVVENAFLILRTDTSRVFARMRVEFSDAPTPIVEAVTVQSLQ